MKQLFSFKALLDGVSIQFLLSVVPFETNFVEDWLDVENILRTRSTIKGKIQSKAEHIIKNRKTEMKNSVRLFVAFCWTGIKCMTSSDYFTIKSNIQVWRMIKGGITQMEESRERAFLQHQLLLRGESTSVPYLKKPVEFAHSSHNTGFFLGGGMMIVQTRTLVWKRESIPKVLVHVT